MPCKAPLNPPKSSNWLTSSSPFSKFLETAGKSKNVVIEYESDVLTKVVEYLNGHEFSKFKEIPKPLPHCNFEAFVSEFDFKFVTGLEEDMFIKLMEFSNTLGLDSLLTLLSAFIACQFRGECFG